MMYTKYNYNGLYVEFILVFFVFCIALMDNSHFIVTRNYTLVVQFTYRLTAGFDTPR